MQSNNEFNEALSKLENLLKIRNKCNENWTANWNDDSTKWTIIVLDKKIIVDNTGGYLDSMFIFKSEELAQNFLNTYKKDIEFILKYLCMWNPEN